MAIERTRIGALIIEKEIPDPTPAKPEMQLQQDPLPEEEVTPRRRRRSQED